MTSSIIFSTLAIVGPGLTTVGAGLLAYDVLRGPLRHLRGKKHADRLGHEELLRDRSRRRVESSAKPSSTGEREVAIAKIDAKFETVVERVNDRFDAVTEREFDRAFRLGVSGVALVALGGVCQTVAAI